MRRVVQSLHRANWPDVCRGLRRWPFYCWSLASVPNDFYCHDSSFHYGSGFRDRVGLFKGMNLVGRQAHHPQRSTYFLPEVITAQVWAGFSPLGNSQPRSIMPFVPAVSLLAFYQGSEHPPLGGLRVIELGPIVFDTADIF